MEEITADTAEAAIQLEPFLHQVGGHSSILCLDEKTVCKPMITQEVKFYETLPPAMKKFTPEYRGIVKVRFEEGSDGYIRVAAACPQKSLAYQIHNTNKRRQSKRRRIRLKNTGSIEIDQSTETDFLEKQHDLPTSVSAQNPNPWVLKCHKDHLSKLRSKNTTREPKFVLLENLTSHFEFPCVVDLKMGTRQYGDNATPEKIEAKSVRAASSTSVQLGVRICGMQVYQANTGKFLCRNKYHGRELGVPGFREGLTEFLYNGTRLRIDALDALVEKLKELKGILLTLDTYRFYTSSLLLLYEGMDSLDDSDSTDSVNSTKRSRVGSSSDPILADVKLIDFAHATHSGLDLNFGATGAIKEHTGPDAGFIFGLSNLIQCLQEIKSSH